jgi:photosystem II stability/assembly factor-like uncharacterized protein
MKSLYRLLFLISASLLLMPHSYSSAQWVKLKTPTEVKYPTKAITKGIDTILTISSTHFARSVDGGSTWNMTKPGSAYNSAFIALNDSIILIASNDMSLNVAMIYRSIDAGISWDTIRFAGKFKSLMRINDFFQTKTAVYAVGDYDAVLKSTDDGLTWQNLWKDTVKNSLKSITFGDDLNGMLISSNENGSSPNKKILYTSDGGFNWDSVAFFSSGSMRRLNAFKNGIAYCAGVDSSYESVFRSTNYGKDWKQTYKGIKNGIGLLAMHFPNENLGFITGVEGDVQRTKNGGKNWNAIPTGASNSVSDICFKNEFYGVAVVGELWKFDNTSNVPIISIKATEINFGYVPPGTKSEKKFEIINSGKNSLDISSIRIEGKDSTGFSVKGITAITLIPDGFADIRIEFHPTEARQYLDTIVIYSNAVNNPEYHIKITGTGTNTDVAENENTFSISPNPATDFLEISYPPLERGSGGVDIKIFNLFGQIQTTSNPTPTLPASREGVRIDVSGLAPGMYFVRIGDKVGKFVKI